MRCLLKYPFVRSATAACVLAMVCSVAPASSYADIFRHVDSHGVEHYTNIQPQGRGWQRVLRTSKGSGPKRRSGSGRGGGHAREPDPARLQRYIEHIREASALYQLPEPFIRAVMRVESNFYADAVSDAGAMGLMQLMPGTASGMGVVDPFNPRQNVLGGARYLRILANKFGGDLVLTIAAYNAGHGAVQKYGGIPPYAETQRYVRRVLQHYYAFKREAQR